MKTKQKNTLFFAFFVLFLGALFLLSAHQARATDPEGTACKAQGGSCGTTCDNGSLGASDCGADEFGVGLTCCKPNTSGTQCKSQGGSCGTTCGSGNLGASDCGSDAGGVSLICCKPDTSGTQCKSQGGSCGTTCDSSGSFGASDCGSDEFGVSLTCCKPNNAGTQCKAQGGSCGTNCDSNTETNVGASDCGSDEFGVGQTCCTKNSNSNNGNNNNGNNNNSNGGSTNNTSPNGTSGGIVPCGKGSKDPCTLCHFITGFQKLVTWIRNIVFIAAMTVIVIGGVMYAVSAGSTAMMDTAKKAITSSLVGFALTLCAWLIVNTIVTVIAQANLGVGATNWYTFTCDTSSSALTGGGTGGGTGTGNGNNAACEKWCDDAGGDADYTSKCKSGCGNNANSNGNGSGCGVVGAGQSMMGWTYTQGSQRMSNGYADCSSFANRCFVNAGCSSPGNSTADMYPKGQSVQDRSSLKPGDIVVYPGHAAVCQNAGCTTIMAASSSKGKVLTQNGDFMFNAPEGPARVLPASQYCPEGANGSGAGC